MNKYIIKLEISAEVEAFDENDAREYVSDIFGVDDEVKSVKILTVKQKSQAKKIKVVVVTGASFGIGKAVALGFSKLGHKVFACSRKMPYLEDLTRLDGGENIVPVQLDITLPDSVKNLSEKIGNLNIDILVNSAGGDMTGPKDGGLEDYTMEEFSEAFNLNVFGTFEVIKTIIPKMKKESNPIIFTLSSVAGQANTNNVGLPYHLAKNSESKMLDFLSKDIYPIRSTDLIISTVNSFRKEEMKDSAMTPEDIFSVIKFISESPSYLTVDKIHLRHINSGGAI